MPAIKPKRSHPPLWLFSLVLLAGSVGPFVLVAMPFLLRREGISVEVISRISAVAMSPFIFMFLWSPVVDVILSRRNWVILGNFLAAIFLYVGILLPRPQYLGLFTAALFMGNMSITIYAIALNGLMAVLVPAEVQGKGAAWFQIGNYGTIPFLAGAEFWFIANLPLRSAAAAIAATSFLPSLLILFMHEPARPLAVNRSHMRDMFLETVAVLRRRQTWLGFPFLLSPIAYCAAYDLFSGIGVDFHSSARVVQWVTGIPGGVASVMLGAWVGGLMCDRWTKRVAFISTGVFAGLVGLAMASAPLIQATYIAGVLLYELAFGASLSSGYALCLDLTGFNPKIAGTCMALFQSAASAPVSYMTFIDGRGYGRWGVRGLLAVDACCLFVAAVILTAVYLVQKRAFHSASAAIAPATEPAI
jgi:MFS transporter, PAT family, beta-lactamase induction signal transducer AmpG